MNEPRRDHHDDGRHHQRSVGARLRANFIAGVLVTAPIAITFFVAWQVLRFIDARVTPFIPAVYNPNTYLPFGVPGVGLVVLVLLLTAIGALTTVFLGRSLIGLSERMMDRVPVVRSVYAATKQIFQTILAHKSEAFRQVVLLEYPRRGIWALGFVTSHTEGEVQNLSEDDLVNVFIPTTPNPTSGFLLFFPRRDLIYLSMSVEEGAKMIISGGIVTPPDNRPDDVKRVKRIVSVNDPISAVITPEEAVARAGRGTGGSQTPSEPPQELVAAGKE